MATGEATGKEARRAAYATYVECFWTLRRLPPGDARRPALAVATRRAEAAWRALMTRAMARDHLVCHHRPSERRPRLLASIPLPELMHGGESPSIGDG